LADVEHVAARRPGSSGCLCDFRFQEFLLNPTELVAFTEDVVDKVNYEVEQAGDEVVELELGPRCELGARDTPVEAHFGLLRYHFGLGGRRD